VGSFSEEGRLYQTLSSASNVVWWGPQPAEALPSLLRCADLLLLVYRADKWSEQLANPHKLLEYLASGRPILATETLEYVDRPDLVYMAKDRDSFRAAFPQCLSESYSGAAEHRKRYAAEHSYGKKIEQIELAWRDIFKDPLFMVDEDDQ
jgi:glycosyltransferase involved in cell wall biosynthesis